MINSLSDWLCNVMLWGAVLAAAALLYETFMSRGFIGNGLYDLVGLGLIVVLSLFWPRY